MDSSGILGKTSSLSEAGSDRLKAMIHGFSGTGKTRLASSVAQTGRTLLIDLPHEGGIRTAKAEPWADNIEVLRPSTFEELERTFAELYKGDHGFNAVVFESVSALAIMAMRRIVGFDEKKVRSLSEIANTDNAPRIHHWGQLSNLIEDHVNFWYALAEPDNTANPVHMVMTSQSRIVVGEEDEVADTMIGFDLSAKARTATYAKPDYVWYTFVEPDASERKTLGPVSTAGEGRMRHVLRVLPHPNIYAKSRVPGNVEVPPIVGRKNDVTIPALMEVFGIDN